MGESRERAFKEKGQGEGGSYKEEAVEKEKKKVGAAVQKKEAMKMWEKAEREHSRRRVKEKEDLTRRNL